MKYINSHFIKTFCLLLLVLFACNSCKKDEKEQPIPVPMSSINHDAIVLSYNKVRFTAEIKNFKANDVLDCGFYLGNTAISCGIPSSENFELVVDELESLHSYSYTSYIKIKDENGEDKEIRAPNMKSFVTDFPIITGFSPSLISDISSITVEGEGFNNKIYLYLVTKPSPSSPQEEILLFSELINNNKYTGSVPVIGAKGKHYPAFYEGAVQPCELYMGTQDKSLMKKIGDISYRYRFSNMGTNVPSTGSFYISVYYAKDESSVENLEVYFGDNKVNIIEKIYGHISSPFNEMIEYYTLKCNIPDVVISGSTYKISVVSPFGEEFTTFEEDELTVD